MARAARGRLRGDARQRAASRHRPLGQRRRSRGRLRQRPCVEQVGPLCQPRQHRQGLARPRPGLCCPRIRGRRVARGAHAPSPPAAGPQDGRRPGPAALQPRPQDLRRRAQLPPHMRRWGTLHTTYERIIGTAEAGGADYLFNIAHAVPVSGGIHPLLAAELTHLRALCVFKPDGSHRPLGLPEADVRFFSAHRRAGEARLGEVLHVAPTRGRRSPGRRAAIAWPRLRPPRARRSPTAASTLRRRSRAGGRGSRGDRARRGAAQAPGQLCLQPERRVPVAPLPTPGTRPTRPRTRCPTTSSPCTTRPL